MQKKTAIMTKEINMLVVQQFLGKIFFIVLANIENYTQKNH